MPFDGSGNYNRVMDWTNDAAASIKIRADRHDQNDDDIAAALSLTLTRDGQSQPTADLPMNGKKLTNLGAPVNPTDAATKGYADTGLALKADKANPIFTGKVTLPTGVAGTPPVSWPNATANPTTPADGDMWPDSAGGGLKHRIAGVTYTYGRLEAAQTWTGAQTFAGGATIGSAGTTGQTTINNISMELGSGRTADGAAFVDFHGTTGTDFDARIIRNSGANGTFQLFVNGTGGIQISAASAANGTFTYNGAPILVTNLDRLDLAAGFGVGAYIGDGAKSGGATYQPTPAGGNFRLVQNAGAFNFTADADATVKSYTMLVLIQNTATAGAVTFVGWSAIGGDPLTTVSGNLFLCSIVKHGGIKVINIQALQ